MVPTPFQPPPVFQSRKILSQRLFGIGFYFRKDVLVVSLKAFFFFLPFTPLFSFPEF